MEKQIERIVMPVKDAIITAAKNDLLQYNEATGELSIYGIPVNKWPVGKKVINRSADRYIIPDILTIEAKKVVPEFITNLYKAIDASCGTIDCFKCPLCDNDDSCIVPKMKNNIKKNWLAF